MAAVFACELHNR